MVQSLWKTVWGFLRKIKIELPYNPAVSLLGIYQDKTVILRDIYTPVFVAALFTIGKTWKQLNAHQQGNKENVVHIYNGILLSRKK